MTRGRFRWRTRIRRHLPWILVDRGLAARPAVDCGDHEFFNHDSVVEHCFHCTVGVRPYDPNHFAGDTESLRAAPWSGSRTQFGPPADVIENERSYDDELRARICRFFEELDAELGSAGTTHTTPMDEPWVVFDLDPTNDRAAGVSLMDLRDELIL